MQGQQGSTPHTTITIPIRTVCEVPPLYMIKANIHFKRSMGNGFLVLCHLSNCFLLYLALYMLLLPHTFFFMRQTPIKVYFDLVLFLIVH